MRDGAAPAPGEHSSRRVTFDVGGQIVGRLAVAAVRVVATALIARALGDEGFGRWATLFAVVALLTPLVDLSLESVAVRRIAAAREEEPTWIGTLLLVRSGLTAFVLVASLGAVAAIAGGDEELLAAGAVLCAGFLVGVLTPLRVAFIVRVRNTIPIAATMANTLLWTGAVVVLARGEASLVAFAAAFVAAEAVATLAVAALALRIVRPRLEFVRSRARELLRIGIPFSVGGLLVLGYAKADHILVFEILGAADAGYYGAAYRLIEQAHMVPVSISAVVLPLLAASGASQERWSSVLQASLEAMLVLSLGALALSIGAADPIMRLVFGEELVLGAKALPVLMAAFVVMSLGYLVGHLVILLELQRRFIVFAAIGFIVNVALNIVLLPVLGFVAAAWTTLLTEIVVTGATGVAVLRATAWRPALGRPLRAVACCALTTGALLVLRGAGAGLLPLVGGMLVVYPVLLLALRAVDVGRTVALLRRQPV